jgi:hypothetical protein
MNVKRNSKIEELLLQVDSQIHAKGLRQDELKKLERRFKLTKVELAGFAICFANWQKRSPNQHLVSMSSIYNPVAQLAGKHLFDNLIQRLESLALINVTRRSENHEYSIPSSVLESISQNQVPVIIHEKPTIWYLCDQMTLLVTKIKKSKSPRFSSERSIRNVEQSFKDVAACSLVLNMDLSYEERLTYYLMLLNVVNGDDIIDISNLLEDYHIPFTRLMPFRKQILTGSSQLIKAGFFNAHKEQLFNNGNIKMLPDDKWLNLILGNDFNWIHKKNEFMRSFHATEDAHFKIITPSEIRPLELYYNEREQKELHTIEQLLEQNRYKNMVDLLMSENERTGITIVLSGGPGTGKTETIQQWARKSNRKLCWVDFASLSSKWVGENEKAIRKVFEEYRSLIATEAVDPILVLNEADGLLTKRVEVENTVDKMSNTVQNLLLEEIEKFSGVLVATTNLLKNIDNAFMRRFLFKIKIENPDIYTRSNLIKRLSFLSHDQQSELIQIPFSGGQLENICRRVMLHRLVNNNYPNVEQIKNWFNEEFQTGYCYDRKQIGFLQLAS